MNCRVCNRPLLNAKRIAKGIGHECERQERIEKENENQVTLTLNKEIPKELKWDKKKVATKIRYKGNIYFIQSEGSVT